jgi:circadian clock protein KaiC
MNAAMSQDSRLSSGISGLDEIISGGWPPNHLYLVEGDPGTGKTTLALQFLLQGAKRGERVLYVTLSESKQELEGVAASHGWKLDGISIFASSLRRVKTACGRKVNTPRSNLRK